MKFAGGGGGGDSESEAEEDAELSGEEDEVSEADIEGTTTKSDTTNLLASVETQADFESKLTRFNVLEGMTTRLLGNIYLPRDAMETCVPMNSTTSNLSDVLSLRCFPRLEERLSAGGAEEYELLKLLIEVINVASSKYKRDSSPGCSTPAALHESRNAILSWNGATGVPSSDIAVLFTELMDIMEGVAPAIIVTSAEILGCHVFSITSKPKSQTQARTAGVSALLAYNDASNVSVSFSGVENLEIVRIRALIASFLIRPCLGNLLINLQQKRVTRSTASEDWNESIVCSQFIEWLRTATVRSSSPSSVSSDISKVMASQQPASTTL